MASRAFSPQAGPSRSPDWQLYRDDVSSIVDSETTERTVRGVEPTLPIHMHDHVRSKWWDREYVERAFPACLHEPGKLATLWLSELEEMYPCLAQVSLRPPTVRVRRSRGGPPLHGQRFDDDQASRFSSLVGPSVHPSLDHSYSSQLNDAADEDSQSYIEPEEGAISGLDMEKAMPHPEALYDFDTNAWLIVCIRPTSRQLKRNSFQPRDIPLTFGVTNPAQRSFVTDEQGLREREPLCSSAPELDDDGGRTIRHHHLHTFSRAVPYTSFLYSEAGNPPPVSSRDSPGGRRRPTDRTPRSGMPYMNHSLLSSDANLPMPWEQAPPALDLTACCICKTYILVSPAIPGVIPPDFLLKLCEERAVYWAQRYGIPSMPSIESEVDLELEEELLEEGRSLSHPTADDVVVRAVETIAGLVYNFLFKGSTNRIKNNTQNFRDRLGRSAAARAIFATLGFSWTQDLLLPPSLDDALDASEYNRDVNIQRHRLLRAWVELQAWLSEYRSRHQYQISRPTPLSYVSTEPAFPILQTQLGADFDQIPRRLPFPQPADDDDDPSRPWHALGLTHDHYPHDVLKFAYFAQLACDPQRTPHWFTHLEALYERTYDEHQPDETHELRQLLYDERARGRWSAADLQNAVATLGLDTPSVSKRRRSGGAQAPGVSVQVALDFWGQRERGDALQRAMCEALFTRAFELELERTYVSGAVRSRGGGGESAAPAQAMRDLATTIVRRTELRSALIIVAQHIGSYVLKELAARKGGVSEPMSLTQAYAIFKVRPDVDDELLVFLYQDTESLGTPQELLRVREALELITVARQSARLEKFLATGKFQFRDAKDIKNMLRMAVASR